MTMKLMKKCALLLLALLAFSVAAGAQETADDPYEFILAKLAADDGRFDDLFVARRDRDPTCHRPRSPTARCPRSTTWWSN